jgi:hypothetical protein
MVHNEMMRNEIKWNGVEINFVPLFGHFMKMLYFISYTLNWRVKMRENDGIRWNEYQTMEPHFIPLHSI